MYIINSILIIIAITNKKTENKLFFIKLVLNDKNNKK